MIRPAYFINSLSKLEDMNILTVNKDDTHQKMNWFTRSVVLWKCGKTCIIDYNDLKSIFNLPDNIVDFISMYNMIKSPIIGIYKQKISSFCIYELQSKKEQPTMHMGYDADAIPSILEYIRLIYPYDKERDSNQNYIRASTILNSMAANGFLAIALGGGNKIIQ